MRRPSLDALGEIREGRLTNHGDVFSWFADKATWTAPALARAMAVSPSTARRYLEDLADAGYVTRSGMSPVTYVRQDEVST